MQVYICMYVCNRYKYFYMLVSVIRIDLKYLHKINVKQIEEYKKSTNSTKINPKCVNIFKRLLLFNLYFS